MDGWTTGSDTNADPSHAAAYGGAGWQPRARGLRGELGEIWAGYTVDSEYAPLGAVLLHRPGGELEVTDADASLMLGLPAVERARAQHDAVAAAYREQGVETHYVDPSATPPPNQMFAADLFVMTPEGAIVGRPASEVRAGEERWVARRLAELGVPILRTVGGRGTFEGADAIWLDPTTVLLGRGLRTNDEGVRQVSATLREMGIEPIVVDLPFGTMHLMGQVRILDRDLAAVWHRRVAYAAVDALRARGYTVVAFPDPAEAERQANNFVTLGPRRILMGAAAPATRAFYAEHGVDCITVEIDELVQAAGGIGCLTGILDRET